MSYFWYSDDGIVCDTAQSIVSVKAFGEYLHVACFQCLDDSNTTRSSQSVTNSCRPPITIKTALLAEV